MADYYPLLAKAVASLADSTPQARNAIYERARMALFKQLRDLDPPVPEDAIEREAHALEVAVAQLETEIALRSAESNVPLSEWDFGDLPPPARAPGRPRQGSDGSGTTPKRAALRGAAAGRAAFAPLPAGRLPTLPLKVRREPKRQAAEPPPPPEPAAPSQTYADVPPDEAVFPERPAPGSQGLEPRRYEEPAPGQAEPDAADASTWVEPDYPFAPQQERWESGKKRLAAVGGAVALIVLGVAIAAYELRDRPEDLIKMESAPAAAVGEASVGKIAERISGEQVPTDSRGGTTRATDRGDESAAARANLPLPLPLRAALLVEAPEEQSKVRTFLGTVIWRVQNVSGGPDEPLRTAFQAEIDIPEEKVHATMSMQKNFDSTLPASHTMKLTFSVPPESSLGNVKQISAVQMRREDSPTGEPLNGIIVPVMENSFLIGLAQGEAEAPNLTLLRSRGWLDVPMVLANGRIAKLTFEKGASGQQALDDAIASWQGK